MAVGVDAELDEDELPGVNVEHIEEVVVSQWREVSADKKHEIRGRVDAMLRPLGFETSLLVIRRVNSLALYFLCMTLSALMGLRQQWCTKQLRDIIEQLFAVLAGDTRSDSRARRVFVKRLIWHLTDYERCLSAMESCHSSQGKQTIWSLAIALPHCISVEGSGSGPHLIHCSLGPPES